MAKNLRLTDAVTIASSGTVSTALTLQSNRVPVAIVLPAAFTGTTVTFQASVDDASYNAVYNGSSQYSIDIGVSRFVALNTSVFEGVKFVKIISGSTETAGRSIYIVNGEL